MKNYTILLYILYINTELYAGHPLTAVQSTNVYMLSPVAPHIKVSLTYNHYVDKTLWNILLCRLFNI